MTAGIFSHQASNLVDPCVKSYDSGWVCLQVSFPEYAHLVGAGDIPIHPTLIMLVAYHGTHIYSSATDLGLC